jgi:hypothetical protein
MAAVILSRWSETLLGEPAKIGQKPNFPILVRQ